MVECTWDPRAGEIKRRFLELTDRIACQNWENPKSVGDPVSKEKKKKQEKTWVVVPKVQHPVVWTTDHHMHAHTHDHIQAQKWIKWKSVTNLKGQGKRDLSQVFLS